MNLNDENIYSYIIDICDFLGVDKTITRAFITVKYNINGVHGV